MFKCDGKMVKDIQHMNVQHMVDTPAFLTIEDEDGGIHSINLNGVESFCIKNGTLHVRYLSGSDESIAVYDDEAERIKCMLKVIGSMLGVMKRMC